MRTPGLVLSALSLFLFAGCASAPVTAETTLRLGMSQDDLRFFFGQPVRIEQTAKGGADWYYRFYGWQATPDSSSGTSIDNGQVTSNVSAGLSFSKDTVESPVHVSADGYVVGPLPGGKIVRN